MDEERKHDAAWLMDAVVLFAGGAAILIGAIALIHLLFSLEPNLPEKLDGASAPELSHPLPYSASVTQTYADGRERTRYYTPKETK